MKLGKIIFYCVSVLVVVGTSACSSSAKNSELKDALPEQAQAPFVHDLHPSQDQHPSLERFLTHQALVDFVTAYGYLARGQFNEARSSVQLLLTKYPNVPMSHVIAADLLKGEGKTKEATMHLKEAARLAPKDAHIQRALANAGRQSL